MEIETFYNLISSVRNTFRLQCKSEVIFNLFLQVRNDNVLKETRYKYISLRRSTLIIASDDNFISCVLSQFTP